jgi:alpha-1,2-mannosyltransferase
VVSVQEVNQSMVGVLTRLLTAAKVGTGRYNLHLAVNVVSWPPGLVSLLIKGLAVGLVGLLAFFCRTKADRRNDPRLMGEFALVVLTMLFVSERSWKHHFVTVLLPYTYLMYRVGMPVATTRVRAVLASGLVLSALLMAATSSEMGGWFAHGQGHKFAQGYGLFFWAGMVLYVLTAWRVREEGRRPAVEEPSRGPTIPAPHILGAVRPGVAR